MTEDELADIEANTRPWSPRFGKYGPPSEVAAILIAEIRRLQGWTAEPPEGHPVAVTAPSGLSPSYVFNPWILRAVCAVFAVVFAVLGVTDDQRWFVGELFPVAMFVAFGLVPL